MNGIITRNRFARILSLPISFPQTDLGSGKSVVIVSLTLAQHQRLEMRLLNINVVAVLTPGAVPAYLNHSLSLCSVGLYDSPMLTSPLAYAAYSTTTSTTNPFAPCVIESPGTYQVIVSNNTRNVDLAVTCAGAMKLYY